MQQHGCNSDYHTKRSKSERKRQRAYDITYMWNLKSAIDEPIYETEMDSRTWRTDQQTCSCQGRRAGLGGWH